MAVCPKLLIVKNERSFAHVCLPPGVRRDRTEVINKNVTGENMESSQRQAARRCKMGAVGGEARRGRHEV